jgi:hypothetical protein
MGFPVAMTLRIYQNADGRRLPATKITVAETTCFNLPTRSGATLFIDNRAHNAVMNKSSGT